MIHNDVLRSVRFMLGINDLGMTEILHEGGLRVPIADVAAFCLKEDEPGFVPCPDRVMAHFLDGLIVHRRGRNDAVRPRPVERSITNNTVLKKLRVAFELKDSDLLDLMASVDLPMSKHELSALFRAPEHANYRACGDQFLRNFLRALTLRERGPR